MGKESSLLRDPVLDGSPPSILYVAEDRPYRDIATWERVARFAWLARWIFQSSEGWTDDMIDPRCEKPSDDIPRSFGKCTLSNVIVAQEVNDFSRRYPWLVWGMQHNGGVELNIRAGDVNVNPSYSDRLRKISDHNWAEECEADDLNVGPNQR